MCESDGCASTTFALKVKNLNENEKLDEAGILPVHIRQLRSSPIKFSLDGFKKRHLAIWKTESETGFESVPGKIEDVLTIRFVLRGSIARKEFNSELGLNSASGIASLFADMQKMQTSPNVSMISCTVGATTLLDHLVSLEGEHSTKLTSFMPVANVDSIAIKSLRASLAHLHNRMKIVSQSDDISYPLLEEVLIYHFLSCWPRVSERAPPSFGASSLVARRARDYIESNLDKPLSLSEVAKVAGVSVRTLQQSFRKEFDRTPVQFITDCRLAKVHEILSSGLSTEYVSQIAAAWGFFHPADFSRRYRAKFGVAPSETKRRGPGF